jgi:hypothetical protein
MLFDLGEKISEAYLVEKDRVNVGIVEKEVEEQSRLEAIRAPDEVMTYICWLLASISGD